MSIFKNRTVVGVICILAALVICFGITPLFNRSISQKEESRCPPKGQRLFCGRRAAIRLRGVVQPRGGPGLSA